jgi:hypothetical protein
MPQSPSSTFDNLLLIARPAAGKSEIIDHIKSTPINKRKEEYHIGEMEELDDFPMLWTWFEEDDILSRLGHPRLYTDDEYNFLYDYLWDVLIERINLEYNKKLRDDPAYHSKKTLIIEFARGASHGGFTRAFNHLSQEIAKSLAILYVNVSWEESFRKNRSRYNPEKPDSILEHGLPDDKMEKLYRYVDWDEIVGGQNDYIQIQGVSVPYVVFENEADLTSKGGSILGESLGESLGLLYKRYCQKAS